ncbi:MAG TPA: polyprenyl synthetase family protein [Bacteroidales bacterium]
MNGFEHLITFFEKKLSEQKFGTKPSELYAPINYTLTLGGKRIRPILTLMACEMYCGDYERALPQSIAIELFHNFTLIHDDIMDNAPIRRGKKTVYKKWDPNIAILSGDTLFALAYHYAQQADKEILPEILGIFNKTAIEVCEGQQYDLNFEKENKVTVEDYIEMIRLKTAVLFAASLKIGSIIGGASIDEAQNLYDFGLNIGLGFQLQDDLLDTFGDESVFGKKTGGDILTNKKTYLFLKAIERADSSTRDRLIEFYKNKPKDENNKVQEVKSIFSKLRVAEDCTNLIEHYYQEGMNSLNRLTISNENKELLGEVARKMINREK